MKTLIWFGICTAGYLILFFNLPLMVVIGLSLVMIGMTGMYDAYFKRKE